MQYIPKQPTPPSEWDKWFTTANKRKSVDYSADYQNFTQIKKVKEYLIAEQSGLCAYCQRSLALEDASIEHLVPKGFNTILSTSYWNLVAVCKNPSIDSKGKLHCDKERKDQLLVHIIMYSNAEVTHTRNHGFFIVKPDGAILAKPGLNQNISNQTESFIDILNLNHSFLKHSRAEALNGILDNLHQIGHPKKREFLQVQFQRIFESKCEPFRQFLLIYLGQKLGIN